MERNRRRVLIAGAGAMLSAAFGRSHAQSYPSKLIKLIVPFPPGGTTDVVARILVDGLSKELNQAVIVENRGGGGGSIGARELARAQPDGYTIGLVTVSTHGTNPAVYKALGYDVIKDFTPIAKLLTFPGVIAVHPGFPAKDFATFMRVVKAAPGKYSYASSGLGGATHMSMELFKSLTGVAVTHVPYRGSGPAIHDVVAGQVDILWDALPSALPFIKSGQLVAIGVAAAQRSDQLPDVPTFIELGVKDYEPDLWNGVVGPAGISSERVAILHAALDRTLKRPEIKAKFEQLGATIALNSPAEFARQIDVDVQTWKRVATFANVSLD